MLEHGQGQRAFLMEGMLAEMKPVILRATIRQVDLLKILGARFGTVREGLASQERENEPCDVELESQLAV